MRFLNIRQEEIDLASNAARAKDSFSYLIIFVFCNSLINFGFGCSCELISSKSESISLFAIHAIGLTAAFKANGGIDGNDFPGRLISIYWITMCRLFVISVPLIAIVIFLEKRIRLFDQYSTWIPLLSGSLFQIILFIMIFRSFIRIRKIENAA